MRRQDWLAEQFELHRTHLGAVAYRMLGSRTEAEDAVQECWLRLNRGAPDTIEDLRGWLTTVVGRICLDALRSRRSRREHYLGTWLPEPLVVDDPEHAPDHQADVADSVGLALLVVLETLTPAERLAFVLHDVFAVPFADIGDILGRGPAAARQLASRARRRVQDAPRPEGDLRQQRIVVDAFLAAARAGDFDALLAVLDPDVTVRVDVGGTRTARTIVGAANLARQAPTGAGRWLHSARPVVVNAAAGLLVGTPAAAQIVVGFTVARGRIVEIDVIAAPAKLTHLGRQP